MNEKPKITYEDKEALNTNEDIPEKNKVTAENMNEIKKGINELDLQLNGLYIEIVDDEENQNLTSKTINND